MEKTGLRRPHFAVIQDFETRSDRTPIETELRFHLHSYYGGMGDENFSARFRTNHRRPSVLPRPAGRPRSLLAGGGHVYRNFCLCDWHHHLCRQEVFRGNHGVRCAPVALADLICHPERKPRDAVGESVTVISRNPGVKACRQRSGILRPCSE